MAHYDRSRFTLLKRLTFFSTRLSNCCLSTHTFIGIDYSAVLNLNLSRRLKLVWKTVHPIKIINLMQEGRTIGVRDGGAAAPDSGSLATYIRAESRHYSGKTQYMFE